MSVVRHAPDPLHQRETLCGAKLIYFVPERHVVASVGDSINCEQCRVVINMATRCIGPRRYMLVKTP